jgi:hypothetical protein
LTLKRTYSIAICILLLSSAILLVHAGTVKASESGYTFSEYYSGLAVTTDGKWTDADEWHDVTAQYIPSTGAHVALFEYKMDITDYSMTWLVEFADNTNDPGDKWQICIDGGNDGGSAPNANDVKLEITGHTTLATYVGSGTGWTASTWAATWVDSKTTSPHDPGNHYILEVKFSKSQWDWGANPPPHGVRIAMYDASNAAQGWVAWPPQAVSLDNPSHWGSIPDYMASPAPEGLTIGVMLALSSVAVVVSMRYFRKPPKL